MNNNEIDIEALSCALPHHSHDRITMAHGGGGLLTHQLIQQVFVPLFNNPLLNLQHDGAILNSTGKRLAFTTDSHVITPLFFPGGDIGSLSVFGTVNDLAMCGAQPIALSAGFIIEEGFLISDLIQIASSMQKAALRCGVSIVTGDTKVVQKGKADQVFINTTGIGVIEDSININPVNARPGDLILLNGHIADHGIAVMSKREGLVFDTLLESDSAPLNDLVSMILSAGKTSVHVLRDPTRGGIGTTLNEIASQANLGIVIEEDKIPLKEAVKGACELLGLDPLFVANEGKCICILEAAFAPVVIEAMQKHPQGKYSTIIGYITSDHPGKVVAKSSIGGKRVVEMFYGEQLPRIC